jgi:TonB-linked SusC/RagA family outer membrane protein
MREKLIVFCAFLFLFCGIAKAQMKVSGTVVSDADGMPVIGASILVEGTKNGTITDMDGKFSIDVPSQKSHLVISYIGMVTKNVTAAKNMRVVLYTADHNLDEIVVTAMGISREKKAQGFASQTLTADQLNTSGTSSLASAMQGKLTGVDIRTSSGTPGASSQIVIRGARSFDGDNTPLYVIDGMPVSSSADFSTGSSVTGSDNAGRSIDLNPDDIESINVLKGQAASALYGIRASNGVILITTKRGSKATDRPVVTFSTDLSAQNVSRMFERQTVYAQGNSLAAYNPSSSMSWGPKISELPNDATYGGNVANKYTKDGADLHSGQYYNPKYADAGLSGWVTPEIHDNVDDFFNTGFTQNASFGISQRKENLNYSFGVSDTYQTGVIPSTGMMRTGARGAVDLKVNDEWKTGFSANYSSVRINSAPGANSGIINVIYSCPAEYDLKGLPYHVPGDPTKQILFRSTNFNNPYWWAANDEYFQHTGRLFGNAYVEYQPKLNWGENYKLTLREQAGIDMYTGDNRIVAELGSAYNNKGEIEDYGVQKNVFNNLFTANFTAKFGADKEWNFGFVLGNEFNHEYRRTWDYDASGLAFYGQPTMGNCSSMDGWSSYMSKERIIGTFGQASLTWKDMLFLTVTGRNDVVSTMPRGSRSFFYPSVSLGWIFTELPELKDNNVISYGKLRASYAQVGQAGQYRANYYYTPSYGSGMYVYTPISYPLGGATSYTPYYKVFDENLKPQNTTNWEFGFDVNLFKNKVRIEYTYSYQDVKDQIFDVPTAGSTGYQYKRTNAGRMETFANEFSINATVYETKDWTIDLGVNYTSVSNNVRELAPGVESIMLGGFVEPQVRAQAGYTYPNIYGYAFQRDENGNLLLEDGVPVADAEMTNLGECTPDFNMGFNLKARWKRLTLAATLDWQKGGKMYHGTNMTLNYFGVTKESLAYHEGKMVAEGIDKATGQPNTIEVSKQDYYQAYYDVTEAGIYDKSFVKLRDLTLSYQLPKFRNLDISVYGFARNVLLWANLPNFDPESSQGNGNMSGHFERFSVPNTYSVGGGFKFTF